LLPDRILDIESKEIEWNTMTDAMLRAARASEPCSDAGRLGPMDFPPAGNDPMHLFDSYVQQKNASQCPHDDEILRVADFMFGSATLDGALQVLQPVVPGGVGFIRQIRSITSSSCLYLVRRHGSESTTTTHYFCFLPPPSGNLLHDIVYCSCRSFLERSVKAHHQQRHRAPSPTRPCGPPSVYCKHLLAIRLATALRLDHCCQVTEVLSDEELSNQVMERIWPDAQQDIPSNCL
jgi:hypothetical protein